MTAVHPLVIGCPFGNYLEWPGVTSTLGTFTLKYRGGLLYRLWRCLRTLRPAPGGWVNRLGLPNPGIHKGLDGVDLRGKVVSIHGMERFDWHYLVSSMNGMPLAGLEFNLSCPNVGAVDQREAVEAAELALERRHHVIAKLPPVHWLQTALRMYAAGVRTFHCCNTLPTPRGGLSGKGLKPYSLGVLRSIRSMWGDSVRLIGGGGVTCLDDVKDYLAAGADHVAVASMLLNPFAWRKVPIFRDFLASRKSQDLPSTAGRL